MPCLNRRKQWRSSLTAWQPLLAQEPSLIPAIKKGSVGPLSQSTWTYVTILPWGLCNNYQEGG